MLQFKNNKWEPASGPAAEWLAEVLADQSLLLLETSEQLTAVQTFSLNSEEVWKGNVWNEFYIMGIENGVYVVLHASDEVSFHAFSNTEVPFCRDDIKKIVDERLVRGWLGLNVNTLGKIKAGNFVY